MSSAGLGNRRTGCERHSGCILPRRRYRRTVTRWAAPFSATTLFNPGAEIEQGVEIDLSVPLPHSSRPPNSAPAAPVGPCGRTSLGSASGLPHGRRSGAEGLERAQAVVDPVDAVPVAELVPVAGEELRVAGAVSRALVRQTCPATPRSRSPWSSPLLPP